MATEVKVRTGELTLTTVKLTPKILKQMPRITYDMVRSLVTDHDKNCEAFKEGVVVGWIHGSAFGAGQEHERYLLLKTGEGEYGLFNVMHSTIDRVKAKQIYIA